MMSVTKKVDINCDILISGGGFTGLAMACALAGTKDAPTGLKIIVIERKTSVEAENNVLQNKEPDGRAIALTAASMRMLRCICPDESIISAAQPVTRMLICDGTIDETLRLPFLSFETETGAACGEPAAFIIANKDLMQSLLQEARARKEISILSPCRIEKMAQDGCTIRATLEDETCIQASLLVVAEGAKSLLPAMANIKVERWNTGQWGLTGLLSLAREHDGQAIQHFLPNGPCALLPLPGKFASLVWTDTAEEAPRIMKFSDEKIREELTKRLGRQFGEMRLVTPLQAWPLSFQIARSFIADRLALVGDTAHVVHPLAGQGFNLALKDVAALTDSVLDVLRLGLDIGSPTVLQRYQRWRHFDTVSMMAVMDGMNRLFSNDLVSLRLVRDLGLGLLNNMPDLKNWMMSEASGDVGTLPKLLRGEHP